MPISLTEWVDRLKEPPLPAMALTLQRVPQLLDSPNTTNADYQRIISRDPGFTLSIFRAFGKNRRAPREPVTNLAHAIALLGVNPLVSSSKELPVLKEQVTGSARDELYSCYSRAGHAAWYAYTWGHDRKDPNPEEMAIAALLNECGEMALWVHAKDQMKKILGHMKNRLSRETAALAVLGFTLDQLSQALAEQWNLPPLTVESLEPAGAFRPRSLGVMLACALARESASSWNGEQIRELIELVAEHHKITFDRATAYVHSQSAEAARDLSGLPLSLTAWELLNLQPEEPEAEPVSEPVVELELEPEPEPEPEPVAEQKPAPAPTKPDSNRLHDSLIKTFKEMKAELGLERVMFAVLTPDRKALRAKFVSGADKSALIRKFAVNLGQKHLFSLLMGKPQSFWLTPTNREKYLHLIPEPLHAALNTEGFFGVSIFVRNRPLGLIYADCSNPSELNSSHFERFKEISRQFSRELENG